MITAKDIEKMDTEEGKKDLPKEFIEEFGNGKGEDEDGSNTKVH